ncbi:MAG: thiolase family protein [Myxococcales bacterium]|nr:MAG: thiolase family protein [Myxococcales bacterium]
MREVVIVSAARTPVGVFLGSLASVPAVKLGSLAIKAAVERAGIKPEQVETVVMGNVLTGGEGQAPARQATLGAGLPTSVPCLTINKVCGSGLKAVQLAANEIALGNVDVAVAGGMESMSNAPFALPQARTGYRMSMPKGEIIDLMVNDGLWDPYNNSHMGGFADLCAKEKGFSRETLDGFAARSFKKALAAQEQGLFKAEIVPVEIPGKKGPTLVDTDENPAKVNFDKIPTLKPVFSKDGVTTAANASSINDGAAAVVLMAAEKAKALGLKPLAKIVSYGEHAEPPQWFTIAPAGAVKKALKRANLSASDVDLFEINEAFAVVTMYAMRELSIPEEKVNIHGGAVALGHPIGGSGARLLVTLLYALKTTGKKRGLATLCIGGGEANAMIVEAL